MIHALVHIEMMIIIKRMLIVSSYDIRTIVLVVIISIMKNVNELSTVMIRGGNDSNHE